MKVFLSWSGDRSGHVARALRSWLPQVLQHVEPWMSDQDIIAGDRWAIEIGKRLEEHHFGILCLTQDNLSDPWLLFEAGALSKALSTSRVCPYLLDVEFGALVGPLAQFQAKKVTQDHTRQVVFALNHASLQHGEKGLDEARLEASFEVFWPRLEAVLHAIPALVRPAGVSDPSPTRTEREVLEDLIEVVRNMDRKLSTLDRSLHSSPDIAIADVTDERASPLPCLSRRRAPELTAAADEQLRGAFVARGRPERWAGVMKNGSETSIRLVLREKQKQPVHLGLHLLS